jgi:hypothetical protein
MLLNNRININCKKSGRVPGSEARSREIFLHKGLTKAKYVTNLEIWLKGKP